MIKLPSRFTDGGDLSMLTQLCNELNIRTIAGKEALQVALENCILLDNKQLDYGPRNISGFGTFGVIVRMNDKFERLKTLWGDGRRKRRKAKNESFEDTLRDISNYALIALLLESGHWPSTEPLIDNKEKK